MGLLSFFVGGFLGLGKEFMLLLGFNLAKVLDDYIVNCPLEGELEFPGHQILRRCRRFPVGGAERSQLMRWTDA